MNQTQLDKIVKKLAKWDNRFPATQDEEVLTVRLEYPYIVVVKYGGLTLNKLYNTKTDEITKSIASLNCFNEFNCFRYLDAKELKIIAEISAELTKINTVKLLDK